jgi:predicted amidohydrolase/diadenosine tetraphosphate (Ap4A) HIT family hydrolase
MNCKEKKEDNLVVGESLVRRAASAGCRMVFLPECFDMICNSQKEVLANLEPLEGPVICSYRKLAKELGVWLSLGGLHETGPTSASGKATNAHVVIDDKGQVASVYRKVHLFNLEIPGVVRLIESEFSVAGDKVMEPVVTPVGKVGLGICYDVRFPEFAIALAKAGADILTYPSSFTVPTGMAHWETLLRARAIENQCYVVAAAQTGVHNAKRSSYGHAMIIDPWGAVIAQCSDSNATLAIGEIDHKFLRQCRSKLPVWSDRRPELYGNIFPPTAVVKIDDQPQYVFGQVHVHSYQVFYRTRHTYAFVNHRPVIPGHVLISPLRESAKRLGDLTSSETADFFTVLQRVQAAIETEYETKSSTIAIQDGPDAGQSISQLHAHLLPRKPTDFGGKTDAIYAELHNHDKEGHVAKIGPKLSEEEMREQASSLRKYFV